MFVSATEPFTAPAAKWGGMYLINSGTSEVVEEHGDASG